MKESIRMGHSDLGDWAYERGDLQVGLGRRAWALGMIACTCTWAWLCLRAYRGQGRSYGMHLQCWYALAIRVWYVHRAPPIHQYLHTAAPPSHPRSPHDPHWARAHDPPHAADCVQVLRAHARLLHHVPPRGGHVPGRHPHRPGAGQLRARGQLRERVLPGGRKGGGAVGRAGSRTGQGGDVRRRD